MKTRARSKLADKPTNPGRQAMGTKCRGFVVCKTKYRLNHQWMLKDWMSLEIVAPQREKKGNSWDVEGRRERKRPLRQRGCHLSIYDFPKM